MEVKHITLGEYYRLRTLADDAIKALRECSMRHSDAEYLAKYNEYAARQRTEDRRVLHEPLEM